MKKFKNLVIGGIETKIFNLILLTVLVLIGAFAAISLVQSNMLSDLTAETSVRQQQTTSGIISDTMNAVTTTSMKSTTDMEARIVDEMFRDIQSRVRMVSAYAGKILSDPDSYAAKPYAGPDPSLNGRLAAQIIWADDADPTDPALIARAGLAANLSELMISLCEATGSDNVYIGMPEGFFLSVNRSSAEWFKED